MINYDSTADTLKHIKRVNELLTFAATELLERGTRHDDSKLKEPEKEYFDRLTPKLADTTYGSEEYISYLAELYPALQHHYKKNSHHPEHYSNGINGMDLFDVLEMLLDWKASTERHNDGNILVSLEKNKTRFNIDKQLYDILYNTIVRYL